MPHPYMMKSRTPAAPATTTEAETRQRPTEKRWKSYGDKRRSGNQLYGPDCCAHEVKTRFCTSCRKITRHGRPCHVCGNSARPGES